jgi:hypothetical protein
MTIYQFAIARAHAQLMKESETRHLTAKEKGALRVLRRAVERYRAIEAGGSALAARICR